MGERVLFISKEMEPEQIAGRMDAALLGFDYDKLRRGMLGDAKEEEYFDELRSLDEKYDDFVISADDGTGGVTAIQGKVNEHNPDMVVIDGSYLIVDEKGGNTFHERAMNISRALKRLARDVELPVYNSTQAGRQVSREEAPAMEDVGFSYAYSQDSDVIMSLYRSEEMEMMGQLGVKLAKVREGQGGHYILNWDFNNMSDFGTLYEDKTEEDFGEIEEDDEVIVY